MSEKNQELKSFKEGKFSVEEINFLMDHYSYSKKMNFDEFEKLAKSLGREHHSVVNWFKRKRKADRKNENQQGKVINEVPAKVRNRIS